MRGARSALPRASRDINRARIGVTHRAFIARWRDCATSLWPRSSFYARAKPLSIAFARIFSAARIMATRGARGGIFAHLHAPARGARAPHRLATRGVAVVRYSRHGVSNGMALARK